METNFVTGSGNTGVLQADIPVDKMKTDTALGKKFILSPREQGLLKKVMGHLKSLFSYSNSPILTQE